MQNCNVPIVYEASGTTYNKPLFTIPVSLLDKLSDQDKQALGEEVQAILDKYEEKAAFENTKDMWRYYNMPRVK